MRAVNPGDILAIRTDSVVGRLIRIGELLGGVDHSVNHIAIAHSVDNHGVYWGIEGRPGGVGWVDLRTYLGARSTVVNATQPKTPGQRERITAALVQIVGRRYDWIGIAADGCHDLGIPELFALDWHGKGSPGHLVCSSLASYVYDRVGLARPDAGDGGRFVQPGDWARFIEGKGWQ